MVIHSTKSVSCCFQLPNSHSVSKILRGLPSWFGDTFLLSILMRLVYRTTNMFSVRSN